jgi:hypothetical protein
MFENRALRRVFGLKGDEVTGKLERRRPLGRSRHRWAGNTSIKLDLREDGVVWTGLIWLRVWVVSAELL